MKIEISIDTTEKFTTRKNLGNLIDMVIEEWGDCAPSGDMEYKSSDGLATCRYSVKVV